MNLEPSKQRVKKLRYEINPLKGEQNKTKIRYSKKNDNIFSENERRERTSKKQGIELRIDKIETLHTETSEVDRSTYLKMLFLKIIIT